MTRLYDAHVHLSDEWYAPNAGQIIRSMEVMGITACCVSVDYGSSLRTLELARRSRAVVPFLGVHPEEARGGAGDTEDLIRDNSSDVAGIGEIGLDKTLASGDGFARQRDVFAGMLELAEGLGKPVSVHSRRTLDDALDTLSSYRIGGVLLHWFDGNKRQLARAMDMGYYVSYGPVLTYADDKRSLLLRTRRDRILVETDGPVRFSRSFGHKPAVPALIPSVIFCVAQVHGLEAGEACEMIGDNTERFLRGSPSGGARRAREPDAGTRRPGERGPHAPANNL